MVTRMLTAAAVFVLVGCQLTETEHATRILSDGEEITFRPLGEFDVAGSESYKGDTPEARAARLDLLGRVMDRVKTVHHVLSSGDAAVAKRRQLRRVWLDAEIPDVEAWFVDQLAASKVLEDAHNNGTFEPSDDVVMASVDRLIGRRSPNAALLAGTLARAEGTIPDARLVKLAEQAAEFAVHWIEDSCVECGRELDKADREAVPNLHPNVLRIQTGVDELRALAARLRE